MSYFVIYKQKQPRLGMIISFSVTNYKSIKDKVTLSFEASSDKAHQDNNVVVLSSAGNKKPTRLLTTLAIYGANASGKSNVLEAFSACMNWILFSYQYTERIDPYLSPFLLEQGYEKKSMTFELEFFLEGVVYVYAFSFADEGKRLLKESLYHYPKGQPALLFERNNDSFKYGEGYKGEKEVIQKTLSPNQLLLSWAAIRNVEIPNRICGYISSCFHFAVYGTQVVPWLNNTVDRFEREGLGPVIYPLLNSFIKAIDTGIEALHKKKEKISIGTRQKERWMLEASHAVYDEHGNRQGDDRAFPMQMESVGTQHLTMKALILFRVLLTGGAFFIDEIESNTHPSITKLLISLFNDPITNPKHAQLVFTTHDITQLDEDAFRRDQIYFTEKNEFGVTELYAMSDFKGTRRTYDFQKWYEIGKFGALPVIQVDDFMRALQDALDLQKDKNEKAQEA